MKPNNFYRDSVHDLLAKTSCDSECNDYAIRYEVGYEKGQAHLSDLEKGEFIAIHKDNFLTLLSSQSVMGCGNQKKAASTLKKMVNGINSSKTSDHIFREITCGPPSNPVFISSESNTTSLQQFFGKTNLNFIFDAGDFVPFPHYRVASSPFDSASTPDAPTNTDDKHTLYGFSDKLFTDIYYKSGSKLESIHGKKKKSKKSKKSQKSKSQKGGSGGGAAPVTSNNDKALIALRIFWFCILYYLDSIPYMREPMALGTNPTETLQPDTNWKQQNINPVLFFLSFLKIENISSKTQMFCRIRSQGAPYEVVGIGQQNINNFRMGLATGYDFQTWKGTIPFSGQFPFEISQSLMATIIEHNGGQAKPRSDDGKFGNTSVLVILFEQWLRTVGFSQPQINELVIIFCRIMKFLGDKAHIILGIIMAFLNTNSLILTGDRPLLGSCINEINHLNSVSDINGSLSVMIKFVNELEGLTKYQTLLTDIQSSNLPLSDFLVYYKYTKQNPINEWIGLKKSINDRLKILVDTGAKTQNEIDRLVNLRYPDAIAHPSALTWKKPGYGNAMPVDPCKDPAPGAGLEPWKSYNELKVLEIEAKKLNNKKLLITKITLLTSEIKVINEAGGKTNAYLYKNGVFYQLAGGRSGSRAIGLTQGFRSIKISSVTMVKNDLQVYSSLLNGFCGILENINDGINQTQVNQWLFRAPDIQLYSKCSKTTTDDAFKVANIVVVDPINKMGIAFNGLKTQLQTFNLYKIAKLVVINYMLVLALKQDEFGLALTPPNKLKLTEEYHTNILDNLSQLSSLILWQGPPKTDKPRNEIILLINLLNSLFEVSVKIIELVNSLSNSGPAGSCNRDEGVLKMNIEPLSAGGAGGAGGAAASGSKGRRRRKSSNKKKKKKKQSGGADAVGSNDGINFEQIIRVQRTHQLELGVKHLSVDDIEITIPRSNRPSSYIQDKGYSKKKRSLEMFTTEYEYGRQLKKTKTRRRTSAPPTFNMVSRPNGVMITLKQIHGNDDELGHGFVSNKYSIKHILTTDFPELCIQLNLLSAEDKTHMNNFLTRFLGFNSLNKMNEMNTIPPEISNIDQKLNSPVELSDAELQIIKSYLQFMDCFRHIYETIITELNKLIIYETKTRSDSLIDKKQLMNNLLVKFSTLIINTALIKINTINIEYYEEEAIDDYLCSPRGTKRTRRSDTEYPQYKHRRSLAVQGRKKSKKKKGTNSGASNIKVKSKSKAKPKPVTKKKKK